MSSVIMPAENPLAATFDLGIDVLTDTTTPDWQIGKIICPRGDAIANHVQVAASFLDLKTSGKDLFSQVDLVHNPKTGTTHLTASLNPALTGGRKDFKWPDALVSKISGAIDQFKAKVASSKTAFADVAALKAKYHPIPVPDVSTLPDNVATFYTRTLDILREMAAKHGGACEVVDLEPSKISDSGAQTYDAIVATAGACSACAQFALTYGLSPAKINADSDVQTTSFRVGEVRRSTHPSHKGGMLFKRT